MMISVTALTALVSIALLVTVTAPLILLGIWFSDKAKGQLW